MLPAAIVEVYKLETNDYLRQTLGSMQMPTVEYKEINMDDYSKRAFLYSIFHNLSYFIKVTNVCNTSCHANSCPIMV